MAKTKLAGLFKNSLIFGVKMSDCIFCRIVNKEIDVPFVFENENFVAFKDIQPKALKHFLVIPKKHFGAISTLSETDSKMLGELLNVGRIVAKEQGIAESGFRFVINSGPDSGMEVGHLHLHILGGSKLNDIN